MRWVRRLDADQWFALGMMAAVTSVIVAGILCFALQSVVPMVVVFFTVTGVVLIGALVSLYRLLWRMLRGRPS